MSANRDLTSGPSSVAYRRHNRKLAPKAEAVSKLTRAGPRRPDFQVHRPDTVLFATLDGLQLQSGVPVSRFRRLALKELADNALDAADAAGWSGSVRIAQLSDHCYRIEDEGDGIAPEQLAKLFSLARPMISAKFWRLPRRGALGNGLRIIIGCVAATGGQIEISTHNSRVLLRPMKTGRTETIETTPVVHPVGMRIVVTFGGDLPADGHDLSWANAAISLAKRAGAAYARNASPHWFDVDHLAETLSMIEPSETTVRQFIGQLDGCSGAKAGRMSMSFGKKRTCRSINRTEAAALLTAARASARPVKPEALGPIGAAAFELPWQGYSRECGEFAHGAHVPQATIPFIIETWVSVSSRKGTATDIALLANRTPLCEPVRAHRTVDRKRIWLHGAGLSACDIELPSGGCSIVLHVTSPLIPISSIGKRPDLQVFLPAIETAIRKAFVRSRNRLPPEPADPGLPPLRPVKPPSHKAIVLANLAEAIAATSEGGRYIFGQRNLFYRVRPYVERETGGQDLGWQNFTSILTDYEAEHGEIPGLIRDPRGSFHDLAESIELGTTGVARYERPAWQFHKVLFCEKEDHLRILQQADWPRHHDCALMSSKGYASRAARDLIDLIADTADREPVEVFCIHDADAAGTMIAQSLQEATRARGRRRIRIIDLGLQPWSAIAMGLPVEDVSYGKPQPVAQYVLNHSDGTDWGRWLQHHRVELNAMTPGELIRWLNEGVEHHGAPKVIPPPDIAIARLQASLERRIGHQERERVLKAAEQEIRRAAEARIAELSRHLPSAADLVADIGRHVVEQRRRHWTEVVESLVEQLSVGGGAP